MPLNPGDMVGAYRIVAPLGQGGTATVYRAYHARLHRYVAIKMIHQAYLEDPNFLARFEREAQIIAALEHPHIIPVYDFSDHGGEPYLVMKLIEGSTLKTLISQRPLSPAEILDVVTPVAVALDYAHRSGVLHRDIKPSNIILDTASTPYLTDFGLARIAVLDDAAFSQDMLMGTPSYISPEQALGKLSIDFRADLYSFGVILYELVVGKLPFSSTSPYAIINDHIYHALPLPSSLNPSVPPQVEAVLLKALDKDPAERYPSAVEMVNSLHDAFFSASLPLVFESDTQPIEPLVVPPPPRKTITLPQRRSYQKLWLFLGSAAATAAFLGVVGLLTFIVWWYTIPSTPIARAFTPYTVPVISIQQANAAVSANPDDPVTYLSLLAAQFAANDLIAIRRTIAQGLAASDQDIRFELTAASLAVQAGRHDVAFLIYSSALAHAENTGDFETVRVVAGEYLYHAAASADRLRPAQVVQLSAELQNTDSPLVTTMLARALLTNDNLRLAQVGITQALTEDSSLAEIHLVHGELLSEQRSTANARAEWERARSAPDAPRWVRDRATELLNTLTT